MSKKPSPKSGRDNHAKKSVLDNRAKQLDPNNDAYWKSRGLSERPPARSSSNEPSGNKPSGKSE